MKRILPLLLCLSLLVLGGCNTNSEIDVNTRAYGFSLALDLDQLPDEILETSLQNIDEGSADGDLTAVLSQTAGDAMNLYAAGVITSPEAIPEDVKEYGPQAVTLSDGNGPLTCPNPLVAVCPVEGEENVLAFLFYFGFDREVFRGQEVTLEVLNCMGSNFSFTFVPANVGPIRYADLKDAEGNMAGTLNLSAYALNATLWGSPFESDTDLKHSYALFDTAGQELPLSRLAYSGSESVLHQSFLAPMDPATVKTVKIGPYTAELS